MVETASKNRPMLEVCTVLIFFSISLVKEIVRKAEIDNEIAELEKEIEELESTNTELADLIQYLNSTSWQEKAPVPGRAPVDES